MSTRTKRLTKDTIKVFADTLVEHSHFRQQLEGMKKARRTTGVAARGFCCTSPSGVGKSSLARYILDSVKPNDHPDFTTVDTIYVRLEKGALPDLVKKRLLAQLGITETKGYSADNLSTLLYTQLKVCDVQLIIIDEFQQLLRQHDKQVNDGACTFVKDLMDLSNISIAMLGVPTGLKIFEIDDQMETRFPTKMTLPPMGCDGKESIREFRTFLSRLQLEFPMKSVDWSSNDLSLRFLLATDGLPRHLKQIMNEALLENRNTPNKELKVADFNDAYCEVRPKHKVYNLRGQRIYPFRSSIKAIEGVLNRA